MQNFISQDQKDNCDMTRKRVTGVHKDQQSEGLIEYDFGLCVNYHIILVDPETTQITFYIAPFKDVYKFNFQAEMVL